MTVSEIWMIPLNIPFRQVSYLFTTLITVGEHEGSIHLLTIIKSLAFDLIYLARRVPWYRTNRQLGSLHLPQLRLANWCCYRSLHARRVLDPTSHIRPRSKYLCQPSRLNLQSTRYATNKAARTFGCRVSSRSKTKKGTTGYIDIMRHLELLVMKNESCLTRRMEVSLKGIPGRIDFVTYHHLCKVHVKWDVSIWSNMTVTGLSEQTSPPLQSKAKQSSRQLRRRIWSGTEVARWMPTEPWSQAANVKGTFICYGQARSRYLLACCSLFLGPAHLRCSVITMCA